MRRCSRSSTLPLMATLLAFVLPMSAAFSQTNVPDQSTRIDWQQVAALGKDQTTELDAFMSNSSFLIRIARGRYYFHFAKGGNAFFWDTRKAEMERGTWMVQPAKFGKDFLCWTVGTFSQPMSARERVDLCHNVGEFVGFADYLSRGDVFNLRSGRAPE